MSKTFFVIFATLLVASFAIEPLQQIKDLVKTDECAVKTMEIIQPEIQAKIQELKKNPESLKTKAELLALIEKAKSMLDKCELNNKVQPVLNDAVEATGVAFLLASNCFKDVGIVFLIADTIVQDPTDWTNDIIVLIFLAILGRQGYADCEKFIGFVL
jgi:hypothetical protein